MPRHDESDNRSADAENETLRRRELERILGLELLLAGADRRAADLHDEAQPHERVESAERSLWGLALSGGGIRSATFSLGALQALAQTGWLSGFHYLSTVSGGGYAGAYLQGLIHRHGLNGALDQLKPPDGGANARNPGATSRAVRELRRFSNFLAPNNGALSADRLSVMSTYLSNMLLTQVQLLALLVLMCFLPVLMYRAANALLPHALLVWTLALLATWLAMALRHHARSGDLRREDLHRCRADERRTLFERSSRHMVSPLLQAAPPVLMTIALSLLALSLWRTGCYSDDCIGMLDVVDRRARALGTLVGLQWRGRHWLAPIAVSGIYLVGSVMWLHWWWRQASRDDPDWFGRRIARHVVFGGAAALALGLLAYEMERIDLHVDRHLWFVLAFGPLLLFGAFYLVSLAHVGLAFLPGDQIVREQWARFMGRCALAVVGGVTLPIVLIVLLPQWLMFSPSHFDDIPGLVVPVVSALTSLAGAFAAYRDDPRARRENARWYDRLRRALIAVAPWAFVVFVLMLAGLLAAALLWLVSPVLAHTHDALALGQVASTLQSLGGWMLYAPLWKLCALIVGVGAVWLLFATFVDENEFSMNGFYRNRLVRCYLAPSNRRRRGDPDADLDPTDDLPLDCVTAPRGRRPRPRPLYPLVCASVNLTAGAGLDWQDRKAASFVFSPLYCGHQRVPLRDGDLPIGDDPSMTPSRLARELTLGTAMAVSGAAISPNMGYHSSPAVAFLLTLFNARLGWWVQNHNAARGERSFVGRNLLSEMLSQTTAYGRHVHVSDGGHFENLGLYELVRRRCRFILSVDASADPDRDFEGLGNAIERCRVDFDAHVEIDTGLMRPDAQTGTSHRCAALGKIRYADGSAGILLYLKPSLLGNEPPDIAHYAASHREFPHEPTSDQFFDERQFEAYRYLGYLDCLRMLDPHCGCAPPVPVRPIALDDHARKERALLELTYRLYEPSNAVSLHFSRHGDALSALFRRLREQPDLAFLDAQFNHGWWRSSRLLSAADRARNVHQVLPEGPQFRECFYFVQELMQFMEGVFVDLELERNAQHPDNRGWINLFRSWSWMPLFRLAWALTAQNRGSRFVRFCEAVLDAPCVVEHVMPRAYEGEGDATLRVTAEQLKAAGEINFVEHALLLSAPIQRQSATSHWRLSVLQLDWRHVLAHTVPDAQKLEPVGMGIALSLREADDSELLVLMRIQDHMRRLGLAARFVQCMAAATPGLRRAHVAAGHYGGPVGEIDLRRAAEQTRKLQQLLDEARQRLRPDHGAA